MHTSASLTINENASSDVPLDLNVSALAYNLHMVHEEKLLLLWPCAVPQHEAPFTDEGALQDSLDRIAPEGNLYRHADEGPDDMPAHVKVRNILFCLISVVWLTELCQYLGLS